ncbi:MAG: hypothetical protein V9G13_05335 [Marmoricola sp.]|jgi:hypothetical protein
MLCGALRFLGVARSLAWWASAEVEEPLGIDPLVGELVEVLRQLRRLLIALADVLEDSVCPHLHRVVIPRIDPFGAVAVVLRLAVVVGHWASQRALTVGYAGGCSPQGLLHEEVTAVTCPIVWVPVAVANWQR